MRMVEILLQVLNSFSDEESRTDVTKDWDTRDLGACLLLGEESCGKTSLLFLAAASAAGREGRRVLFLAPSPVQALPSPLLSLEPSSLRRIQFAYPRSAEELLEAVASLHESPCSLPSLILLDGLDRYLQGACGQDMAQQVALIAALLRDSATWLSEKLRSSTEIIATLKTLDQEETAVEPGLPIIERYFPVKCMVKEEPCKLEGAQSYLISFAGLTKSEAKGPSTSQSVEDCTWEMLYEADNVTRIHPVTREKKESEETQDTWGSEEGASN
ncbi:ATPase SWSAP1 [Carcharodon carcharias]|uniref:ATPase SWSAP1 n=1 Tax=Carcharodon carcharias TaxID=13397 RepID=UPI001B7E0637|nr:ATPase SWSAP1 [Carcharodon carcharias]